jgi:hypothetical protein
LLCGWFNNEGERRMILYFVRGVYLIDDDTMGNLEGRSDTLSEIYEWVNDAKAKHPGLEYTVWRGDLTVLESTDAV